MQYLFIFLIILSGSVFGQPGLYERHVSTADGRSLNMADFKGAKILVAAVSPPLLQKGRMAFLDSLQQAFPTVKMIVLPAQDFDQEKQADRVVAELQSRSAKEAVLAQPAWVKKTANDQHPLMQWLTNAQYNKHFNTEVYTDEQIYVISESGILYAKLEKGVPLKVIEEVLRQEDVKQ